MKKIFLFLVSAAVLSLVGSFFGSFAQTQAGKGSSFVLYDGLAYKNKPDLTRFGMKSIYIAYTSEIWNGVASRDIPNEIAVRSLAQKTSEKTPLVLDVEHWSVQGKNKVTEESINKLIQIVDWVHKEKPNLKVGYFGLMPVSNAWKELNYVRATDSLTGLGFSKIKEAYRELQEDNARMKRLAAHVDFVCPVLYTFNNLNGAAYEKSWTKMAKNAIDEAGQYGKPIYAFLWPQFFDLKDKNGDNAFIPADFWRRELELVRGSRADGLIVWGSSTFRKTGWNENDPWWKVTKDFISGFKK